jgi:hypothetical protein
MSLVSHGNSVVMSALEAYLTELREIHDSGAATEETSGYPALKQLLDAAGQSLKPKVRCIIQLKNNGAGLPDGGLFTPEQLRHVDKQLPLLGVTPTRGPLEVKAPREDLGVVIKTKQIKDYVSRYGQLLLTNYRQFVLLKHVPESSPQQLESFCFSQTEAEFWTVATRARKTADALGERFHEYLRRALLHAAPLNNPRDVAFFLASYARDARARVEASGGLPALAAVRTALEEALGMKFEDKKGEHFFRSTLVQTVFYGVFSAWVLWHKEKPARTDAFDWRAAAWSLHVPMIKALFEQVATPTRLGPLGLVEVLDWTAAALNRVDRPRFFANFVESHAVQYFYEPFLEAFDPELRKELGVWYTPPEIVQYQVARVDAVLRSELNIPDGLADPRVFVLDPCCGTGAYLVEVLRRIVRTLEEEKGEGALAKLTAKEAAKNRVYGFELLPAPFVVAHLQMGLLLQNLGVPLDDEKDERAGIFLTNALTGWDFRGENKALANWPELEAERAGAGKVKQEKPILVILGNPPYNGFAGVSPEEEQGLVELYKGVYEVEEVRGGKRALKQGSILKKIRRYRLNDPVSMGGWGIKKFNLDDLYVRFFRLAERRIAERTGTGIVCYISNFSYLDDPSFVIMRERFLAEFDTLWFDCLNGDSRETGKVTPDGKPDPSVFSTQYNREGIRVGTAIGLLVRKPKRNEGSKVFFRQFWGANKRVEILESLKTKDLPSQYATVAPERVDRFAFVPSSVAGAYLEWPRVPDLAAIPPFNGPVERRALALISTEKATLVSRLSAYFDKVVTNEQIAKIYPSLMMTGNRIVGPDARAKILGEFSFDESRIVRYPFKPYDVRWCYLENLRPLFSEPSPQLLQQRFEGNAFFLTRDTADKDVEGPPFYFSSLVCDYDSLSGHARHFPLRLVPASKVKPKKKDNGTAELGGILQEAAATVNGGTAKATANLSPAARAYLIELGVPNPDDDPDSSAFLWLHALAIGYSPMYLAENANGIRQDWPRIPLPGSQDALLSSAELGRRVAELLETEAPATGVTAGQLSQEIKGVAVLSSTSNLGVTAGWGHAGKDAVTMPGKGKLVTRAYSPQEMPEPAHLALLGQSTHDVYLNETTCWRNVPEKVWDFTIGGYQVMKKWLSYREHSLLDRNLTPDEAREVTHMARRIAALLLLTPALDANYAVCKSSARPLPAP